MGRHVLITGGAGFIGAHLADELLRHGHRVRVLDSLVAQVHGPAASRPEHLDPDVDFVRGDVRDATAVREALAGIDVVHHLAALVGVGQSMYAVSRYTEVNGGGTAVLLQALIERPVERLIVASSMSVYGEGLYLDERGTEVTDAVRPHSQLHRGDWEPRGRDGGRLTAVATPESKPPSIASVYALSKFDQERLSLLIGDVYRIPTIALRLFNVYGPRHAQSMPGTGVLPVFASRLLEERPPIVYEDGEQRRDFVHVHDVARAFRLAMDSEVTGGALNIGSGRAVTVNTVADMLARRLGHGRSDAEIVGRNRHGDVRHCFADIGAARRTLGYEPRVSLEDGIDGLAEWLRRTRPFDTRATEPTTAVATP